VLQSNRVDVFMGYSENPMNPPQGKETGGFLRRAAPSGGRADRPGAELQIELLRRGLTRRDGADDGSSGGGCRCKCFFFNLGIFWMNFVANVETVRDDGDL
jgi:hypothetical protein